MTSAHLTIAITACALTAATTAHAQWIDDSTMHMVIADGPNDQVQPKIAPTADGGCYVSWFSNDPGYDVRLQRLDSSGNEMWAHNGILIADRGFSSTQDYDLDVDTSGHAVICFRDDRFGGTLITAQRIAPDGTATWGANGIQFGNGTDFVASPDIATTTDGNTVVGWINELDSHFAKINPSGTVLWSEVITDPDGDSVNLASMHGSDAGAVIVSWVQFETFLGPKHLYVQKIVSDGSNTGTVPLAVFDGGSLQFGNFPEFVTDGAGGAVFSWYDTANGLNVYVQHILSTGAEAFPHNGVAVSINPRDRVSPAVTYDPVTGSVYAVWTELDNNQSAQGIYAQRIDSSGNRMWTAFGKSLAEPDLSTSGSVNAQIMDGKFVALWLENAGAIPGDRILAHAINPDGSNVWPFSGTEEVASDFVGRSRLRTAMSTNDFVITACQVGVFGTGDIETHNINPDGSLGVLPCAADLNGDGTLDFFDISFFLSNSVDFNGDTVFDFFDISDFLANYSAGCP